MKINLELNIPDDRKFLNFWDALHGDDVVAEIKDGKLFLSENDGTEREITYQQYFDMVEERIKKYRGWK